MFCSQDGFVGPLALDGSGGPRGLFDASGLILPSSKAKVLGKPVSGENKQHDWKAQPLDRDRALCRFRADSLLRLFGGVSERKF